MKLSFKIFLIFPLLTTIITGCYKNCDEFNKEILEWMPYKLQDKIIVTGLNQTDTLTVTDSKINHTDKIKFFSMCMCMDFYIVSLSSDSIEIQAEFYDSGNANNSDIYINHEYMNYSEQLDNLVLNGHNYNDLQIYKGNTALNGGRFDKVIISKSIGIVAIIEKNRNWIILDNNTRNINTSDLNYYDDGCD